jgi:type VI secretion system protein ImpM
MSVRFSPALTGYFGKLPAYGDFVRSHLPADFLDPWDGFCRRLLTESRAALGEDWEADWMVAPIWHFLLPPGVCGAAAVRGVWLPSIDQAGRHFPFTLLAFAPTVSLLETGQAWAQAAEALGLEAVVDDLPQRDFMPRLQAFSPNSPAQPPGWWTEGNERVAPCHWALPEFPPNSTALLRDASTLASS